MEQILDSEWLIPAIIALIALVPIVRIIVKKTENTVDDKVVDGAETVLGKLLGFLKKRKGQ